MLAIAFSAALVLVATTGLQSQGLVNGGFEDGVVGEAPPGWRVPTPDYQAETRAEGAQGARCAHLGKKGGPSTSPFGNLMQSFDAVPWRAKPIRLRARVRVEGSGVRAQMWLRVDREGQKRGGLFDNMGDRPIRSTGWTECEITGIVDPDARVLNVGVMLFGEGDLWVDAVELEATGPAIDFFPAEAPRALTDAGLANLLAHAELFGYVRHFHPSDESATANWDQVAVQGVRAVEGATSPEELAAALQAHFAPLAPTLRVFPQGKAPEPVPELETAPESSRITYWEHMGFGQSGGVYSSQRLRVSSEERLPADVPAPSHPYTAELAGGVACLVPLSLHADAAGTLPRATPPPEETDRVHRPSGDDRATRLADVVIAWNVFQHFYPYFDVTPVDWQSELEKALRAAATDAGERAFLDTLRRLVAALKDGHGYVGHACDVRLGFLPLDWDWIEGRLVVTAVAPGPAPHPAPGDVVLAIDGVPVDELFQRTEERISGATPQWIRGRALGELRTRATVAACALELSSYPDEGKVRVEVTPAREPFEEPPSSPQSVAELEPGVWYVDLGRAVDADLEGVVEQLADARGIVFDLRGYPRGVRPETLFAHLIEEPVSSQQWNIPRIHRPNREQLEFQHGGDWLLQPSEPYFQAKKAFLTGGGAISYAESCMGIVEHYRLAEIVGGPTAGTNGNVNPFVLPGGYSISWTGMKVLKQDGARHHGVGIQPTLPVARTRRGAAEKRDEVLERGLAAVKG